MQKNELNLYRRARKTGRMTQEQAAEALHLSERSIKDYEQDVRLPDNNTVVRMAQVYRAPWLLLEHAAAQTRTLGILPEQVTQKHFSSAVLALINRCQTLSDDYARLMAIAEDGRVDLNERADFNRISAHIRDVLASCYQVLYADGTKIDCPDVSASEQSKKREREFL